MPTLTPAAWAALAGHRYPGNVRELSHAVHHAVVMSGGGPIGTEHLPASIQALRSDSAPLGDRPERPKIRPLASALRDFEREYLASALRETSGRRSEAAAALEISRKTLWEKLRAHRLSDDDFEAPASFS
jgi:DNA-binding NtrC family response regulator